MEAHPAGRSLDARCPSHWTRPEPRSGFKPPRGPSIDAGRREPAPRVSPHFADVQVGVLPCQPNTFHHIPNLTSPLGLDSGLGGYLRVPSRPSSFWFVRGVWGAGAARGMLGGAAPSAPRVEAHASSRMALRRLRPRDPARCGRRGSCRSQDVRHPHPSLASRARGAGGASLIEGWWKCLTPSTPAPAPGRHRGSLPPLIPWPSTKPRALLRPRGLAFARLAHPGGAAAPPHRAPARGATRDVASCRWRGRAPGAPARRCPGRGPHPSPAMVPKHTLVESCRDAVIMRSRTGSAPRAQDRGRPFRAPESPHRRFVSGAWPVPADGDDPLPREAYAT